MAAPVIGTALSRWLRWHNYAPSLLSDTLDAW